MCRHGGVELSWRPKNSMNGHPQNIWPTIHQASSVGFAFVIRRQRRFTLWQANLQCCNEESNVFCSGDYQFRLLEGNVGWWSGHLDNGAVTISFKSLCQKTHPIPIPLSSIPSFQPAVSAPDHGMLCFSLCPPLCYLSIPSQGNRPHV